jgi:predicted RNase H-like HicB family nuclease
MPARTNPKPRRRGAVKQGPREFEAVFIKRAKWWVGWTDEVPGAVTQGKTLAEAKENLRDAIKLMLEPIDWDAFDAQAAVVRERIRV